MRTAVSAPGKVFLAGGYLVLDREYTALVFGLSARIHVIIQFLNSSPGVQLSEIIVQSPQFREAVWKYGYHQTPEDGGIHVTQLRGGLGTTTSTNPFIETTLSYALTYITSITKSTIRPSLITILADNDYYSQPSYPEQSQATTDSKLAHSSLSGRFSNFGVKLSDANKTGLGSSAALVTALTGALLSHYLTPDQFSLSSSSLPTSQSALHNLAQASHCAAQGKVGSGFDVAAAVYGTCIYRRFSPSILSSIGELGSPAFSGRLKALIEDTDKIWDTEIAKGAIKIPEGMQLVMCDVDCGSQTVSMVKGVQAWRNKEPAVAKTLWDSLQKENEALGKLLLTCTPSNASALTASLNSIREHIREMGTKSGVPIEPPEQTELLDAVTNGVEGVYGGVVPGAGGYDAVVFLIKDSPETETALKAFLSTWSVEKKSNVKLLNVKGEMEGAKEETEMDYGHWIT